MVTTGLEWLLQSTKDCLAVVIYFGRFTVKEFARAHNLATKRLRYRLVTETNTEYRQLAGEVLDDLQRYARVIWSSGPGRYHDSIWLEFGFDFLNCDLIITTHFDLLAQIAEILHEVVSERIVVVDD